MYILYKIINLYTQDDKVKKTYTCSPWLLDDFNFSEMKREKSKV